MFSQDEMERELYEGRLKARRDIQTRETLLQESLEKIAELEQRRGEAAHERDRIQGALKSALVGQIQL